MNSYFPELGEVSLTRLVFLQVVIIRSIDVRKVPHPHWQEHTKHERSNPRGAQQARTRHDPSQTCSWFTEHGAGITHHVRVHEFKRPRCMPA